MGDVIILPYSCFLEREIMKYKYLFIALLLWGIHQIPDILLGHRDLVFTLVGNQIGLYQPLLVTFLWLSQFMVIGFAVLIAHKSGLFGKIKTTFTLKRIVFLILCAVSLLVINYGIAYLKNTYFPNLENKNQGGIFYFYHTVPKAYFLFSLVISGPFFEELVFRACLFKLINNDTLSFVVSTVIFPLFHVTDIGALIYIPSALLFTYLYAKRKVVTDNLLVHMLHNLFSSYSLFL